MEQQQFDPSPLPRHELNYVLGSGHVWLLQRNVWNAQHMPLTTARLSYGMAQGMEGPEMEVLMVQALEAADMLDGCMQLQKVRLPAHIDYVLTVFSVL